MTPYFFRYIYSPLLAQTLGRGVSLTSPRAAYVGWVVVIELCLAAWLVVLWRSSLDALTKTAAICIMLVNQPYLLELHMGQFTFVAVACALLAAMAAAESGLGGAALLAAGVLIKTFPVATLPAFAGCRRAWVVGLGGLAAFAGILLASAGFGARSALTRRAGSRRGPSSLRLQHPAGLLRSGPRGVERVAANHVAARARRYHGARRRRRGLHRLAESSIDARRGRGAAPGVPGVVLPRVGASLQRRDPGGNGAARSRAAAPSRTGNAPSSSCCSPGSRFRRSTPSCPRNGLPGPGLRCRSGRPCRSRASSR